MHLELPLVGAEIGVAGGSNSADFLNEGLEKIYCIDNWATIGTVGDMAYPQQWHDDNYALTVESLSQFDSSRYTILRGLSSEMCRHIPDNSLGLVYIDGDHSYEGCKEDIKNYYPKLVDGGIMAFHDFMNMGYGVAKAVIEFANENVIPIHYIPETSIGDAGAWLRKQ